MLPEILATLSEASRDYDAAELKRWELLSRARLLSWSAKSQADVDEAKALVEAAKEASQEAYVAQIHLMQCIGMAVKAWNLRGSKLEGADNGSW